MQAGHVAPREPGIGGVGTTREQELVLAIRSHLVFLLDRDPRFMPIAAPGDIPDGIKVDAALFLHGDGSNDPRTSGYCFGYPKHPVNARLAHLIGERFDALPGSPPHRTDNYTRDLAGYYGFRKVESLGPEVVVEHGFLTNPGEQMWLFANVKNIATAEYVALIRYFGLKPRDRAKRLGYLRRWILRKRAEGRSWKWIKQQPYAKEYYDMGGK